MTKDCRIATLCIGLLILVTGCQQQSTLVPGGSSGVANSVVNAITNSITQLATEAEEAADIAAENGLASDETRGALAEYHNLNSFMLIASSIDNEGIIMAIEPEANSSNEGNNISHLPHIQAHQSLQTPYLSDFFESILDDTTLTLHWPVTVEGEGFIGSIAGLFDAEPWGQQVIDPYFAGNDYVGLVIDTDGLIIYDTTGAAIGENVLTGVNFTDTAFWQSVLDNTSGADTFTLAETEMGGNWATFSMYEAEWRVLVFRAL